jgi:site-specific DNA-methyltransferase (adenine-specific)
MVNRLYVGDNYEVMFNHFTDQSVDLVYLDPPFNSNREYNVIYPEAPGAETKIKMFEDIWKWDQECQLDYEEIINSYPVIGEVLVCLRKISECSNDSSMAAYIVFMTKRLIQLKRVLKKTGNIFLHCDQTACYHLKFIMDSIFGRENYRNHLIWGYHGGGVSPKAFARKHDDILFYAAGPNSVFNVPRVHYSKESQNLIHSRNGVSIDGKVRDLQRGAHAADHFDDVDLFNDQWGPMSDYWKDIKSLQTWSRNRLGQGKKPEPLLARIIRAGSNEGNLVLDPFVGYGTTVVVSQALKRDWVGIDISEIAIQATEEYLTGAFSSSIKKSYELYGFPVTIEAAIKLAEQDKMKFQNWICHKLKARFGKRGADKGIDGIRSFRDDSSGLIKSVIISVKGGSVGPAAVRELHGTVEQTQNAVIGVLVTLTTKTDSMMEAAAKAGFYESSFGKYPKVQLLTAQEIINGVKIKIPEGPSIGDLTFPIIEKVASGKTQKSLGF